MPRMSDNLSRAPRSSPAKSAKFSGKSVKPSSFDASQDPLAKQIDADIRKQEILAAEKKLQEARQNLEKVEQSTQKVTRGNSKSSEAEAEAAMEEAAQKAAKAELFTALIDDQNRFMKAARDAAALAAEAHSSRVGGSGVSNEDE